MKIIHHFNAPIIFSKKTIYLYLFLFTKKTTTNDDGKPEFNQVSKIFFKTKQAKIYELCLFINTYLTLFYLNKKLHALEAEVFVVILKSNKNYLLISKIVATSNHLLILVWPLGAEL